MEEPTKIYSSSGRTEISKSLSLYTEIQCISNKRTVQILEQGAQS